MHSLAARRYHRAAPVVVMTALLGLIAALYTLLAPAPAQAHDEFTADQVSAGQKLFAANCATCHGLNAEGSEFAPSLVGVGPAAVDFQVGTGRMPAVASGPQAEAKATQFSADEIAELAAFVGSLGTGPSIPDAEEIDASLGSASNGMLLFRTNCAMCHGSVGGGGALTQGKFAPSLWDTDARHIYEAMLTGPQSMPVFNDANITPEGKRDIIAYLEAQRGGSPGGLGLGSIGPVSEGLWGWLLGIGLIIAITVWVGSRSS